jgi:hypothetical protein
VVNSMRAKLALGVTNIVISIVVLFVSLVIVLSNFDDNIFYFDKTLKLIHLEKSGPASKMLSTEYYKSMVFYYKYFNFNMKFLSKIFYFKQLLRDLFYKPNNTIIENESKLINFFINK